MNKSEYLRQWRKYHPEKNREKWNEYQRQYAAMRRAKRKYLEDCI